MGQQNFRFTKRYNQTYGKEFGKIDKKSDLSAIRSRMFQVYETMYAKDKKRFVDEELRYNVLKAKAERGNSFLGVAIVISLLPVVMNISASAKAGALGKNTVLMTAIITIVYVALAAALILFSEKNNKNNYAYYSFQLLCISEFKHKRSSAREPKGKAA